MKNISGFTIIELLVTMTVLSVLLVVGVPSYQEFMKAGQITTANNELVSAMQVARSAAIQVATPACVCSSSSTDSATPKCDGGNNWEKGWISFVDTNTAATTVCVYEPSDDDVLLKVWNGVNATEGLTVRNFNATVNALDYVRFNSRGIPVTVSGGSLQGMFVMCDDRGLKEGATVLGRGVILSASGSMRTTKDAVIIGSCL